MFALFKNRLRAFARDTAGNVTIETVIWLPLMVLVLGATFSFYEAFRQKSLNTKAAFTISDALSRETDAIDDDYLDGMVALLDYMTLSSGPYSVRVSMVRYSDTNGYIVDWSQARGGFNALDSITLSTMEDGLPTLLNNESVIVVETQTDFTPTFKLDVLQPQQFYNFVFARPRFAPKLVWQDQQPSA